MAAQVLSNEMVAHVWAQQRQPEARSANGNFYFNRQVLYSYGSHFIVGIMARDGTAWLNSDSYSMSTHKQQNHAYRAVSHRRKFSVPKLGFLEYAIGAIDASGQIPAGPRRERAAGDVLRYLEAHWQAFPATGSGSAAIHLLYIIGSRRTWEVMRRGFETGAKRAKDQAALAERRAHRHAGKALSARPIPIVRADAWIAARNYRQSELREMVSDAARAHKATPAGEAKRRAALWTRLKAMRAILKQAESLSDRSGNMNARGRAHVAIAALRRFKLGLVTFPGGTREEALAHPGGAAWRYLADNLHVGLADAGGMPPAMRVAAFDLMTKAQAIADEREGEETRKSRLASYRRTVLGALQQLNQDKRFHALGGWLTDCGSGPDVRQQIGLLQRMIAAIDTITRYASPDNRYASNAPAIVARLRSVGGPLQALHDTLQAEYGPLVETRDAAMKAERERANAERERIAAMSNDEIRSAWMAGAIQTRSIPHGIGYPFLRAIGATVDGCNVTGGTLETSQGATVPLRHAFRVFQFVAACRAAGKGWTPSPIAKPSHIRVGHFTVDSIAADGSFIAGCHSIRWAEIAALADTLGVAECLAPVAEIAAELESNA